MRLHDPDGDDGWLIAAYYGERDGKIVNPPPDVSWLQEPTNVIPITSKRQQAPFCPACRHRTFVGNWKNRRRCATPDCACRCFEFFEPARN